MNRCLSALGLTGAFACTDVRALIIDHYPTEYGEGLEAPLGERVTGRFDGNDAARAQLAVALAPVVRGLSEPTDVQFPPMRSDVVVVLEKGGKARVFDVATGRELGRLLDLDVQTRSEQGLLGLAFHPAFGPTGGQIFIHEIVKKGEGEVSRISRWTVTIEGEVWSSADEQVVLEVPQPYANHNAGQLLFGPDGMLYVGFGDGGWRDDPHNNGQDPTTFLGAMLRLDVDHAPAGEGYAIPTDNPYLERGGVPDEVWATGLRNPWRFSFAPDGRMVVADVGQNLWEEVDIVGKGDNMGWARREGRHCFPPDQACGDPAAAGFVEPIWEYGRDDGQSITGGYVYTGPALPGLQGRYIVGDFLSGRVWAVGLPGTVAGAPLEKATALGHFDVLISSFGRDAAGEVYMADYKSGTLFRLVPAG
jgi:glucose/arabinose dehydrogenase